MIDIIGAITLTALAVVSPAAVILASPLDRTRTTRVTIVTAAWFAAIVVLGMADVFGRLGTPLVAVAVVAPVVIVALSAARVSSLRVLTFETPVAILVAIHVGRVLGAFFIALHGEGRLPATFARSAGWGDIVVAVLALPVVWLAVRRAPFWRATVLLWNLVAFIDLVTAVTLGIGSAPGTPLRFIVEDAVPGTINTLPWILIPAFLVPVYLLTHLAVFAQLAHRRGTASSGLLPGVRRSAA
jgi:hypothetical protein